MKNLALLVIQLIVGWITVGSYAQSQRTTAESVTNAMRRATQYMVDSVSTNGAYARLYTADFSRRWHELEAYKSQVRIEEPGTLGMGNLYLDAYHITGDEYYYQAAVKVAEALVWGQMDCGGWHYFIDFAGDRSLKAWYRTIGKHAWGFEEHYYYRGNATFDDEVTSGAARFLLRMYLEKLDPAFKPALDKAIAFILESQYPLGGWPQRYPLKDDYTSHYTFNDNVIAGNLEFLIDCYATLGGERFLDPIRRAMNFYLLTQQGDPQPGWAQQYDEKLQPASARNYEPAAIVTGQTYDNIRMLMKFYRYTGDRRFLTRIPDAIAWLEQVRLPDSLTNGGKRTHPFFVEIGTNRPLWAHRSGSGVYDGKYWVDYNTDDLYGYGDNTVIGVNYLKDEYNALLALPIDQVTQDSPLKIGQVPLKDTGKHYFAKKAPAPNGKVDEATIREIIKGLDSQGRWLSKHEWISDPYTVDAASGQGSNTAMHSDPVSAEWILDPSDSDYISVAVYIKNMRSLLAYLASRK